jgi:cysteine-rich repeat protein
MRLRAACASVLCTLALPATAMADPIDLTLSCPPYDGVNGNDPGVGALVQPSPLAVPTYPVCAIYIGNNTGSTISALDLSVVFPSTTAELVSTSLLPDGIPALTPSGPPWNYTYRFAEDVDVPAGFEAPTFDYDSQTATWSLANVPPGTRELRFHTGWDFHWSHYDIVFPEGTWPLTLTGTADGTPIPGTRQVDLAVNLGRRPDIRMDGPGSAGLLGNLASVFHAGRRVHANYGAGQWGAHTNAQLVVYLPYWDGSDFVADDGFDPALHTPAVDLSTLDAEAVRRASRGYGITSAPHEIVAFDPVTTGSTTLPWTGPASGPNAHRMLVYDPGTNTLTATFGTLGTGQPNSYGAAENHHWQSIRWSARINPAVAGNIVADTTRIPTAGCLQSDQVAADIGGVASPGLHTDWCRSRDLPIAAAEVSTTSFSYHGSVHNEAHAFAPQSQGRSNFTCNNSSSQTRDVDIYTQMPGDTDVRATFERAYVSTASAFGPDGLDNVEVYVSEAPSDYGFLADLTGRALPQSLPADWVLCASGTDSVTCERADVVAAGVDPDLVEEVRIAIAGQKPQTLSTADAFRGCNGEVRWNLAPEALSSIDETVPCGPGDSFSRNDMSQAAIGSIVDWQSRFDSGETLSQELAWNGEITEASKLSACHLSATDSGGEDYVGWSCGYGRVRAAALGDYRTWHARFVNSGSLANISAPYRWCATLPYGFQLANTQDPTDAFRPTVSHNPISHLWNGTPVPIDRYTYTWSPVTREMCVDVPYSGDTGDLLDVLSPGEQFAVNIRGVFTPGADRDLRSSGVFLEYEGYDTCGAPGTLTNAGLVGGWSLALAPAIEIDGAASETAVGDGAEFCYDIEVYNDAWDDTDALVNANAGSARDSVVYQPIPRSGDHPGVDLGDADATFVAAEPVNAGSTWIATADLDPATFAGSTALDDGHTNPDSDFVKCTDAPAVCDAAAADAALTGSGRDHTDVRWVAFDLGEVPVTDAEPWGVAPLEGNTRLSVPVRSRLCVAEAGSIDGAVLRTQTAFRSNDTADASSGLTTYDVAYNALCPPGAGAAPEDCNGIDDNCNGAVDEGLTAPLGSIQNGRCLGSLQVCDGVAGWQDPDYSADDPDGDGVCAGECREGDTPLTGTCDGVCNADDELLSPDCNADCPGDADTDGDTVCDAVDVCPGFPDLDDADGDGTPDGCDPCGNGILDPGEVCDDGNVTPLDGCSPSCTDDTGTGPDPIDCLGAGDPRQPRSLLDGDVVLYGNAKKQHAGDVLTNVGDFDGDGVEDLAIGAYQDRTAGTDAGVVFLFFGPLDPATTSTSEADVTIYGPRFRHAGFSVAGIGDHDGDGRDDLLIGGWDERKQFQMDAWLVYGRSAPPAILDLAVDADATFTAPTTADGFGEAVGGIGDIDGDGTPDFAIGAPLDDTTAANAGAVYVFTGGPYIGAHDAATEAHAVHLGLTQSANTGDEIAGLGDMDGDGYDDYAVGAPKDETGGSRAGAAFLFYGGPAAASGTQAIDLSADATLFGRLYDRLGSAVASAGDVDGDGTGDLWVSAPHWAAGRRGAVYLLLGGPALSGPVQLDTIWEARFTGRNAGDYLGTDVAGQFDADGDGHLDVVLGGIHADGIHTASGAAWVAFGPFGGTTRLDDQGNRYGILRDGRAGGQVATFSDMDGDGYGDFAVADRRIGHAGIRRAGMVSVFLGGQVGDNGTTWYADRDGDGYGDDAITLASCNPPPGYISRPGDCNDTDPAIHPFAAERDCSLSIDFNCDGHIGVVDPDGDGYWACDGDCDEDDASVNAGGVEVCGDGIDNNCDALVDDPTSTDAVTYYPDGDGDGYGSNLLGVASCDDPGLFLGGVVFQGGDCNDADPALSPEALEVCDSVDNDCDGTADEGTAVDALVWHPDADGDGFGDAYTWTTACTRPAGYATNGTDCDDADIAINPAAPERCDRLDNDCDGATYLGGKVDLTDHRWLDIRGESGGDRLGDTVVVVPDVDGDGRDDLLLGASQRDEGGNTTGVVYLRANRSVGGDVDLAALLEGGTRAWDARFTTERNTSRLGAALAGGDLNGDGHTDLVLGAPGMARPNLGQGAVFVFYGPIFHDADVDTADVILTGAAGGDEAGGALEVGDLDGDGVDDLIVGAPGNLGAAYVLYGDTLASGRLDAVADAWVAGTEDGELGARLAILGDSNGDPHTDLAIAEPKASALDAGAVHVVYGTAGRWTGALTAGTTLTGPSSLDRIGIAMDAAGDVDGDGLADLLVGSNANRVWLLRGGAIWPSGRVDSLADTRFTGAFATAFGRGVHGAGDLDGDGLDDLVLGVPRDDTAAPDAGAAWIVYGGDLPAEVVASDLEGEGAVQGPATLSYRNAGGIHGAIVRGDTAHHELGRQITSGDLDGDGQRDLVFGAPDAEGSEGRVVGVSRARTASTWATAAPSGPTRPPGTSTPTSTARPPRSSRRSRPARCTCPWTSRTPPPPCSARSRTPPPCSTATTLPPPRSRAPSSCPTATASTATATAWTATPAWRRTTRPPRRASS